MSKNSSNNRTQCFSVEDLVAYLYDEMPSPDRGRYDVHLAECRACTEEFASLSESRFSVYEWQRAEFADLRTPEITGPWEDLPEAEIKPLPNAVSVSWLDRAKASIASYPRWTFATVAGGFLVMIIWLGFINLQNVRDRSEAILHEQTITESKNTFSIPNEMKPSPEVAFTQPDGRRDVNAPSKNSERGAVPPSKRAGVVAVAEKVRQHHQSLADPRGRRPEIARKAPNLSGIEEDEDTTVRLADLFAEVGGGK